eukprot:scaffold76844_cov19-Tisochrysis_lutea.AAC.1
MTLTRLDMGLQDKVTSLYMHLVPVCVSWANRWFPEESRFGPRQDRCALRSRQCDQTCLLDLWVRRVSKEGSFSWAEDRRCTFSEWVSKEGRGGQRTTGAP